jgi:hypothetical protein
LLKQNYSQACFSLFNILQAKGKKRDAKSAKSRKSVQTLESTPEEAEPEDNKKVDEKTKVEPVEKSLTNFIT